MREVRHHARIANPAFENVAEWLPGSRDDRLRLIDNAFVRSFAELMAKRKARIGQWAAYMNQFASRRDGDGVLEVLQSEYGIHMIPEAPESTELCKQVREYVAANLRTADNPRDQRIVADKGNRDASLYCDMVTFIDQLRAQHLDRECLLVSSGRRLSSLETRFGRFGSGHFVVNIATVLQLLSLVPGVSLHLGALRAYLFEGSKFRSNDDVEKLVLRVLKNAGDIDLPFAKRKFLAREVKRRIIESAASVNDRTRSSRDLAKGLMKAANSPSVEGSQAAEILVGALQASATWSKKDEEIARLKRELEARRSRR